MTAPTPAPVAPRVQVLRSSLLASLGLLHLACGGTVNGTSESSGGTENATGASGNASISTAGQSGSGGQGMVHPTPHVPKPTCTSPQPDAAGVYVSCTEGYTYRKKSDRCQGVDTGRDE